MATRTANVIARVEPDVKEKAENILKGMGIPSSVAINMFYRQIITDNGLPFQPSKNVRHCCEKKDNKPSKSILPLWLEKPSLS